MGARGQAPGGGVDGGGEPHTPPQPIHPDRYNGKLHAPELLLRAAAPGHSGPPRVDVVRDREDVHCLFDNCHLPADLVSPTARAFPYRGRALPPSDAVWTPTCVAAPPFR